ncbi:hypothetical protein ACFW34_32925 [Streptomyces sp. NPDC058848]|uniref:hypothetical protein n=1 Tax=unclassified Streptomyces TaxID=2593676 RepID=UPI0036959166
MASDIVTEWRGKHRRQGLKSVDERPTVLLGGRGGESIVAATSTARLLAVAALLSLVTATGCGDSGGADGAPSNGARTTKPGASRLFPPAPSHPATARRSQPAPSAADGRDLDACKDGDCQVLVTEPVTIRFREPTGAAVTLEVTEVGPNEVAFAVKSPQSQSKNSVRGPGQGCITVLRRHGSGTSCGGVDSDHARPSPRADAVVIQVVAGEDGTAVLDIVSS